MNIGRQEENDDQPLKGKVCLKASTRRFVLLTGILIFRLVAINGAIAEGETCLAFSIDFGLRRFSLEPRVQAKPFSSYS